MRAKDDQNRAREDVGRNADPKCSGKVSLDFLGIQNPWRLYMPKMADSAVHAQIGIIMSQKLADLTRYRHVQVVLFDLMIQPLPNAGCRRAPSGNTDQPVLSRLGELLCCTP